MGRRKGVVRGRDSCDMPFHAILTATLASGAYNVPLVPGLFLRVGTEADAWALFRVRRLKFRLHRESVLNGPQVAAYQGAVQDNPPATVAQASEILPSCFLSALQTVPTEWISVPKSDLSGPFPWYKTVAGTPDPSEESPGFFNVVGTGTDTFYVEFRGVFEFKVSLATANTPAAIALRRKVREDRVARLQASERDILLKILSTSTPLDGRVKP